MAPDPSTVRASTPIRRLRQTARQWLSPRSWALIALVLAAVTWGTSFLLGKLALRELTAMQVVGARFTMAVAILGPWALRDAERPDASSLFRLAAAGLCMVPMSYLLQFEGLNLTTAARAALIIGAAPAVIAVAAMLFRGERPPGRTWVAAGISTVGVVAIVGTPGGGGSLLGDGLVFVSLLGMAGWAVLTKGLLNEYRSMTVTVYSMVFGLAGLSVVMAVRGSGVGDLAGALAGLTPTGWTALIGLGVGCTALTYVLWTAGLRRVDVSTSGVIINLEPLTGAVLGILFLGDPVTWGLGVGGACILGATVLLRRGPDDGEEAG